MKFIRRHDINNQTRLEIALYAILMHGVYGTIVYLSRKHSVSRTFIYKLVFGTKLMLDLTFNDIVTPQTKELLTKDRDRHILLLRLEGKCSIQGISNILESLGTSKTSEGYISERLKCYGQHLSNTLTSNAPTFVNFASDEIFANSKPILITIEPNSTAILRIDLAGDRKSSSWKHHWAEIEKGQFHAIGLVSDRGTGLLEGLKGSYPQTYYYPDLFHELRELTSIKIKLEKDAYKSINLEDKRKKVLKSACSDSVINRRLSDVEKASNNAMKAIEKYDSFSYLYHCIQTSLDVFNEYGALNEFIYAKNEIQTALELMEEISPDSAKNSICKLRQKIDETLQYFKRAKDIYQSLLEEIKDSELLGGLCLAWQFENKIYQAKNTKKRDYYIGERDFWLSYMECILEEEFDFTKEYVFGRLNMIVRSSSLIEMVNSLIRPYLNACKGQITQDTLNLLMFYHNHRKYNDGRRKGKAPIEILTGKPLEKDWVDLLLK